jgi:hypothetical protein
LGAAFAARDAEKAEELVASIEEEGAAAWKLRSTLQDLEFQVQQAEGHESHAALSHIYERLQKLAE